MAVGYNIVDARLCQIAFEKLLHDSQSLYTDIETLVCNIVEIFDRIKIGTTFYADINDVLKGIKVRSDSTNTAIQELHKESLAQ